MWQAYKEKAEEAAAARAEKDEKKKKEVVEGASDDGERSNRSNGDSSPGETNDRADGCDNKVNDADDAELAWSQLHDMLSIIVRALEALKADVTAAASSTHTHTRHGETVETLLNELLTKYPLPPVSGATLPDVKPETHADDIPSSLSSTSSSSPVSSAPTPSASLASSSASLLTVPSGLPSDEKSNDADDIVLG